MPAFGGDFFFRTRPTDKSYYIYHKRLSGAQITYGVKNPLGRIRSLSTGHTAARHRARGGAGAGALEQERSGLQQPARQIGVRQVDYARPVRSAGAPRGGAGRGRRRGRAVARRGRPTPARDAGPAPPRVPCSSTVLRTSLNTYLPTSLRALEHVVMWSVRSINLRPPLHCWLDLRNATGRRSGSSDGCWSDRCRTRGSRTGGAGSCGRARPRRPRRGPRISRVCRSRRHLGLNGDVQAVRPLAAACLEHVL